MKNIIFTIMSEEESKAEDIAKKLSKELNIPFYKDEILDMTSKSSNIDLEIIKNIEDKIYGHVNFPIDCSSGFNFAFLPDFTMIQDRVFLEKAKIVKKLAKDKSCIIFGKCYNYILRNRKNCINVFIYSKDEDRLKSILEKSENKPRYCKKKLKLKDKKSYSYYQYFTGEKWDNKKTYDILLNTSCLSIDTCVKILKSIFLAYHNN